MTNSFLLPNRMPRLGGQPKLGSTMQPPIGAPSLFNFSGTSPAADPSGLLSNRTVGVPPAMTPAPAPASPPLQSGAVFGSGLESPLYQSPRQPPTMQQPFQMNQQQGGRGLLSSLLSRMRRGSMNAF